VDLYRVTLPDGRQITKPVRAGASDQEIRAAFKQDLFSSGLDAAASPIQRHHPNNALAAIQSAKAPSGYDIPGTQATLEQGGLADRMRERDDPVSTNFEDRTARPSWDRQFWLTHPHDPEALFWLQNFTAGYNDLGPPPLLKGRR
jgi:hypothetical protein